MCQGFQEIPLRQSKFARPQMVSMLNDADIGRPFNKIQRTHEASVPPLSYKHNTRYAELEVLATNGSKGPVKKARYR